MIAYKLLTQRKDGTLGSLFINRRKRLPLGVWLEAENHRTPGYAQRPGWHTATEAEAPHLTMGGRVWAKVEIEEFYSFSRPKHQGGTWYIAKRMKLLEVLTLT